MLELPSMRDGRWIFHSALQPGNIERVAEAANILSMFRVRWVFPEISPKFGRYVPFFPFPYRTKRGAILFPSEGHAWIMRDELLAGLKWAEVFGFGGEGVQVEEWSEFIPGNDEKPYAFVAELYEMRRQAKLQKEYDIIEMAIKLCLNSLYGKTVQSVGGTEDKPPSCACPYYGAAITAHCRTRVLRAALTDPYAIIGFMTDGICSTRELKGLQNVVEVFDGKPPPDAIVQLGDWEFERMAGGFFLQAGVCHIAHKNGKAKDRTRGADPRRFILKMELRKLMLDRVLPEWKEYFDEETPYALEIEMRNYVTAGSACASPERFKLIGRWGDVKRKIDIHSLGVKRMLTVRASDGLGYEYYCSGPKVSGPIHRGRIKFYAQECEASEKDVAACLRSGEALRRRFLVPSLPAINPTPDELSAPCEPEWLNAVYDDEYGLDMTEEDEDTGEILIGAA